MSVELRSFVKQTLVDILQGVQDAQAEPSIGANVAPKGSASFGSPSATATVTFDVAVTAESSDATQGGAGFKVAVMGIGASAGGEASAGSRNVAVTHIKFQVPVTLPGR